MGTRGIPREYAGSHLASREMPRGPWEVPRDDVGYRGGVPWHAAGARGSKTHNSVGTVVPSGSCCSTSAPPGSVCRPAGAAVVSACVGGRELKIFDRFHTPG